MTRISSLNSSLFSANTRLTKIAAILATILFTGCASQPKPLPHVAALYDAMSKDQAAQVIQGLLPPRNSYGNPTRTFITGHIGLGMCRASHLSLDESKGPGIQVTTQEISFNAARSGALVKSTQPGKIVSITGATAINQYSNVSYREHLRFDNIQSVKINEPRLLRTKCGRQNGQSEVVIYDSSSRWYAVLIPTEEKERFIAAMMRLRPGVTLDTEPEDDFR